MDKKKRNDEMKMKEVLKLVYRILNEAVNFSVSLNK